MDAGWEPAEAGALLRFSIKLLGGSGEWRGSVEDALHDAFPKGNKSAGPTAPLAIPLPQTAVTSYNALSGKGWLHPRYPLLVTVGWQRDSGG